MCVVVVPQAPGKAAADGEAPPGPVSDTLAELMLATVPENVSDGDESGEDEGEGSDSKVDLDDVPAEKGEGDKPAPISVCVLESPPLFSLHHVCACAQSARAGAGGEEAEAAVVGKTSGFAWKHILGFDPKAPELKGSREAPKVMGGFDIAWASQREGTVPRPDCETYSVPPHVQYTAGSAKYFSPNAEVSKILQILHASVPGVGKPAVQAPAELPVVRLVITSESSMHRTVSALALLHQTHLELIQGQAATL